MGDLILFISIVSQLFSKKLDQPNIIYCIVSPTLKAQLWQALDLAYCVLFMVVSHIKICSFKLRSQPQEASSKTRRSCSYITRQCATMYNALFECISRGPADWEMLLRLKEIFWVQYKLSSINSLCGIMFITTGKKNACLSFSSEKQKTRLWWGIYKESDFLSILTLCTVLKIILPDLMFLK